MTKIFKIKAENVFLENDYFRRIILNKNKKVLQQANGETKTKNKKSK